MGIGISVRRHHRVDAVGAVVLLGILAGVVVGLASGSARLVLLDGTVPTAVLGAACFGSLLTSILGTVIPLRFSEAGNRNGACGLPTMGC